MNTGTTLPKTTTDSAKARVAIPLSWNKAAAAISHERAREMLKHVARGRAEWERRLKKLDSRCPSKA